MLGRLFYLAPVTLVPLAAQSLVDADHLAAARDAFAAADSAPGLLCQFTPIPPELNFNLRFLTGYSAKSTMNGDRWEILLRVTPDGREPVYLTSSVKLAESTGTFVVGEGAYRVDALMKSDSSRVCTAKWRIQAKLQAAERHLAVPLPAGAVTDLAAKPARTAAAVEPKLNRLTVLLHAAPLALGRVELQTGDLLTLVGALEALVENVPARSTRLVIFSLDQRAVVYQKDDFTADDLDQVSRTLSETKFGVVDYRTLQKATGPLAMAEELLRAELARRMRRML
jgi:hypothetical protein